MKVFLLIVFVGLASDAYAYPAGEVEERSIDDLKAELIRALEERYPHQRDLDYIAPYFTFCPADITVSAPPGSDSVQVSWEDAIVTDNSGVQPKVEMSPPNPNPFSVGQHLISYRATDGAGNVASCIFFVTVVKAEKRSLDDLKADLIRALEERLTEEDQETERAFLEREAAEKRAQEERSTGDLTAELIRTLEAKLREAN